MAISAVGISVLTFVAAQIKSRRLETGRYMTVTDRITLYKEENQELRRRIDKLSSDVDKVEDKWRRCEERHEQAERKNFSLLQEVVDLQKKLKLQG